MSGHSGADGHDASPVDVALARLADLDGRPVAEHPDVIDDVHRRLRDALATLDEA